MKKLIFDLELKLELARNLYIASEKKEDIYFYGGRITGLESAIELTKQELKKIEMDKELKGEIF